MKILVPVKRVVDHMAKIHIKPDESGVVTDHVKMSMNPFDDIAVEQALVLREQGHATHVTVLSIGPVGCVETVRHGLAMGADSAIHVDCSDALEPLDIAHIITHLCKREAFGMVILGKQAIDNDCNQVGQMTASLLQWPQGTFASFVGVENKTVLVKREVDQGIEHLRLTLPCVITTDLRLNQPRYATLPNVMKAKSKPLETLTLSSLGYTPRQKQKPLRVRAPAAGRAGVQVASVQELVDRLKQAQVL